MRSFAELAAERYSLKKYSDRPLEEDKLMKILEVGNLAPTARNCQAHRIYVLRSPEAIAKANELTACTYGATTVLLFTYSLEEVYTYPGDEPFNSGAEDCAIVASHIMLEAADLGVGSCWVNRFEPAKAKALFAIPDGEVPVLVMPLGYPAEGAGPLPNHTKKKKLEETVRFL